MNGRDIKFGIQIGSDWPKIQTNLGLFKISFSTFWLSEPKCNETDLKKYQIYPILGQSDPIWMLNLTSLVTACILLQEYTNQHNVIFKFVLDLLDFVLTQLSPDLTYWIRMGEWVEKLSCWIHRIKCTSDGVFSTVVVVYPE